MQRPEYYATKPRRYTGGELLQDGRLIDLVRDSRDGLVRLVSLDTGKNKYDFPCSIELPELAIWAIDQPQDWIRAIRVPQEPARGATLMSIFGQLRELFLAVGNSEATLLAAWVLATWWPELTPCAPSLLVCGPMADAVLEALELVCRRSILVSGNRPGSFPRELAPTILVSTANPGMARQFLGYYPAARPHRWCGSKVRDEYAARVVAYADDAPPVNDTLTIVADFAPDWTAFDADQFQASMMGFRMEHYVEMSSFPPQATASDTSPVLATLLVGVRLADELGLQVEEAFKAYDQVTQAEVAGEEQKAIVRALAEIVDRAQAHAFVAELAEATNRLLRASGSFLQISPRQLGDELRQLGIPTERLSRLGRGVKLTRGTRERVQELLKEFSLAENCALEEDVIAVASR